MAGNAAVDCARLTGEAVQENSKTHINRFATLLIFAPKFYSLEIGTVKCTSRYCSDGGKKLGNDTSADAFRSLPGTLMMP